MLSTHPASSLRLAPLDPSAWWALETLLDAIRCNDDPASAEETAELFEALARDGADAELDSRAVWQGEELVGYACNLALTDDPVPGLRLTGGVHPQWRHLGLGRSLLGWQLESARSRLIAGTSEQLRLVAHADATVVPRGRLFERAGLVPVRRHLDYRRLLLDEPHLLPAPAGLELTVWQPVLAEDVRRCHNAAFAEVPGSREVSTAQWLESLASAAWHPEHSWIALDPSTREVVGYALTHVVAAGAEEMGWTTRFGVLPAHRGRGLAAALLSRSLHGLHAAGVASAGLGIDLPVDTESRLFDALEYRLTDCVVRHEAILGLSDGVDRSR